MENQIDTVYSNNPILLLSMAIGIDDVWSFIG